MKKNILFLIVFLFGSGLFAQQYPLFTNYVLNDFSFNPAIAGSTKFVEAKFSYRTQWVGIEEAPKTRMVTVQGALKKIPIGVGGYIYNDVAGQLKRTGVSGALSYGLDPSEDMHIAIGLSGGLYNIRLGDAFLARDVVDPTLYGANERIWTPDLSIGTYMTMKNGLFVGLSAPQLLRRQFDFKDDVNDATTDYVPHFYGMVGYAYPINEKLTIEPSAFVKYTNGAPISFDVAAKVTFDQKYWGGLGYRAEDAGSIMIGADISRNIGIAYAYDFTLSDLNEGSKGSHEFVLTLRFNNNKDSDEDGVPDDIDECPEEPGTEENKGCPEEEEEDGPNDDKDNDGVLNKDDKCPEVAGLKNNAGCPLGDRDKDGIRDDLDQCPDIAGLPADNGCPLSDRDKDGIVDSKDKCPDTPGPLSEEGCPIKDTDGDGIADNEDTCPSTFGKDGYGCPVISAEEKAILELAIKNLYFDTDKDIIKSRSYVYLDRLADLMVTKPNWKVKMTGHTDDRGPDYYNLELSKRRVEAATFYLLNRGMKRSQLITEYYGERRPVASNVSEGTRKLNRRVEMEFVFE
ncbi:MAG: PorP/SprF family type IX secretion system membrane protein [Bacteroidetes bacterium]|nr:PorP/SprF family type IX secretion system membrane protein [Bacteroidota bacterium]